MPKQFEIINHDIVYSGFFNLERYRLKHTLFAGGWSESIDRELFRRNNCVGVVLYDPKRDEVVLLEQFRVGAMAHAKQPASSWLVEIVAGAIEPGETPEAVAFREAEEEAGCKIRALKPIYQFYTTPGGSSELLSLYCGWVDSSAVGGIHGLDDEGEDIRVFTVKFQEAFELIEQGVVNSGIPIIALQWLALNRKNLQAEWV